MHAWQDVRNVQREMLAGVTFADLLERVKSRNEQMYHI